MTISPVQTWQEGHHCVPFETGATASLALPGRNPVWEGQSCSCCVDSRNYQRPISQTNCRAFRRPAFSLSIRRAPPACGRGLDRFLPLSGRPRLFSASGGRRLVRGLSLKALRVPQFHASKELFHDAKLMEEDHERTDQRAD
jgi:hypothetical protein